MPDPSVAPLSRAGRVRNIAMSVKADVGERRRSGVTVRPHWRGLLPRLERPIFILGAPRSGTTFLGRAIADHAEISYHFEPVAMKRLAPYILGQELAHGPARSHAQLVYKVLLAVSAEGHLRLAEKTPQNCFLVDFLASSFPTAAFVYIYRDGRDSVASYLEKPWLSAGVSGPRRLEPGGYQWGPHPRFWVEPQRVEEFETSSDATRCAWAWRRFNEAALDGLGAVERTHPVVRVRYEDLVHQGDQTAAVLCRQLGLDPVDQDALRAALRRFQPSSIGRFREALAEDQVADFYAEASAMLRRLGYPT
jgi:hypothetical protein